MQNWQSERIEKLSICCSVLVLLLLPGIFYYASQLRFGTTFVENWLPGDDAARARYGEFRSQFGDDQFLIISWKGAKLGDPRLSQLSGLLKNLQANEPDLLIQQVVDTESMLARLEENRIENQVAKQRLRGLMIGPNDTSLISLKLEQASVEIRKQLMERIRELAAQVLGEDVNDLVLAGEPFQIYMIDRTSREAMERLVLPSSILALSIAWFCIRSLKLTLLVFVFAGLGQILGMATVSYFLGEMIAVLVVLPTLVFMLTLSAAVHLTNYLKDCRVFRCRTSGLEANPKAGVDALRIGASPCVLATMTTAFGLGSLFLSQLSPVWHFGSLAALSLIVSTAITLGVFPAAAKFLSKLQKPMQNETEDSASIQKSSHMSFEPTSTSRFLARLTYRYATLISALGVILLGIAALGLGRLQTSTEFEDMFTPHSDAIRSLHWVRQNIGPLNSLEFLVCVNTEDRDTASLQNSTTQKTDAELVYFELQCLNLFEKELGKNEMVDSTFSALTFVPSFPQTGGMRGTIQRAVLRRNLMQNMEVFHENGLLSTTQADGQLLTDPLAERVWRISVRVQDLRGDNYLDKRESLLSSLDTLKENLASRDIQVSYELTGLRTVVEKAHFALISDLLTSFLAAFLLITPVMMLIVRGFLSGILLMIPNVLPVAFVFGCMGWLGVKLDVASILTASVALGIAVDDTLHFVTWYFRSRRSGSNARESVETAIRACARPMLHTTIICSAAMFPFFFAEFTPTSKFAMLMILILSGAIVGDLILLPALLQSPFGSWIGRQKKQEV